MNVLNRLFPSEIDNRFEGSRAALWLLGIYIALKLVMSVNSIVNSAQVASSADGIPLETFSPAAAREVILLFALVGLGQLALAMLSLIALLRYRAMVPLMFLLLLGESLARRLVVSAFSLPGARTASAGWLVNIALLALLLIGLALSLWKRGGGANDEADR